MGTGRLRPAIGGLALVLAVSALVGSVGLATGVLTLDRATRERLPLHSPVLGGCALAAVVALPNAVLAVLAARRSSHLADASILAGLALVDWIAVEAAVLRAFSPLQPACAAAGLLLVLAGTVLFRRETHSAPPSSRAAPIPAGPAARHGR